MFPISASVMPAVRTRQALLIIDLQNDFVSPDGALPVHEPDGFMSRTLEFVKAFRESDVGDVIWVRSEFDTSRALSADGDQIITSSQPFVPQRISARSSRGRTPTSGRHDDAQQEADDEAFLSKGEDGTGKVCVLPGTDGAELAPQVRSAVESGKDITITKTHYSAFASGQKLIQTLRGRFITEMYVCGALSNISIYATALDAGKHGYDMTIVEDCCGYRNEMRHINAMKRLEELLGTEPMSSEQILDIIRPRPKPSSRSRPRAPIPVGGSHRSVTDDLVQAASEKVAASTGLSPLISSVSLSRSSLADVPAPPPLISSQPQRQAAKPPAVQPSPHQPGGTTRHDPKQQPMSPKRRMTYVDPTPLEVDPNLGDQSADKSSETDQAAGSPSQSISKDDEKAPDEQTSQKPSQEKPELSKTSIADSTAIKTMPAKETQSPDPPVTELLCEGDTTIITDVLPEALASDAFERLKSEVNWAGMSHLGGEVPRRVAVQGDVDEEGNMPVYRHPSDESPPLFPFTPTVLEIKKATEEQLGHPVNHVLIQHYRSGNDYISEHSDKTLDIVRGSFIANVSLGAQRTMVFRTKRVDKAPAKQSRVESGESASSPAPPPAPVKPESKEETQKRQVQRAALPHNSLCRMGLKTNERWLHAIKQDKRADRDKTAAELAFGGERISLTFRHIGTHLNAAQDLIWGQGATGKTMEAAQPVVNGQTPEAVKMLQAFGSENHSSEFDWEERYGDGFNVVHMGTPKRFCRGPNPVMNMCVEIALSELGIPFASGAVASGVRFEDNDIGRAVLDEHSATLLYLDAAYGAGRRHDHSSQAVLAKLFGRFTRALGLWEKWQEVFEDIYPEAETICGPLPPKTIRKVLGSEMKGAMSTWDDLAKKEAEAAASKADASKPASVSTPYYIAGGDSPSIADYALWPVLHEVVRMCGSDVLAVGEGYLAKYYDSFKERSAVAKVLNTSQSKAK
ncbi:hypothetical protein GQ53DRAFT_843934 [Thozetella sp. PMI_491]|nr:hypothetical protein GQ53DRAFT_843934 [Thozetella sp. PMI_491]